jgi:hypothetical protein
MALTKLERAKRQSIQNWIMYAERCLNDGIEISDECDCGFCNEYGDTVGCKKCPVCISNNGISCLDDNSWYNKINDDSFTDCLAVLIYIHQF